jgi:hypothetical protein
MNYSSMPCAPEFYYEENERKEMNERIEEGMKHKEFQYIIVDFWIPKNFTYTFDLLDEIGYKSVKQEFRDQPISGVYLYRKVLKRDS